MEKIIGALWRDPGEEREAFNTRLLAQLPRALGDAGASGIRLNLRDAAVDPAAEHIQAWQEPQQDAVVQYWLPSSNARFRKRADEAIARHCQRFAAWLVAESTIIGHDNAARDGERLRGWSQASFITFRPDMSREQALAHWHGHHTEVAIETQSNFEYVQNLIVMPLTGDAPAYDAFVEECFPVAAMASRPAFFDAGDDHEKYEANLARMMESCAAFIDFDRVDVMPTSQFDFADQTKDTSA